MEPVLSLRSITLTYHSPDAETLAIKDLNLDVERGEFVAIVGPSGCGKSTVLSIAAGLLKPSSGTATLLGKPIDGANCAIGYMLQRDHLFDWRTIWQNVLLGLQVRGADTPEAKKHAMQLIKTYGLYDFRNQHPRALSGGMRQRAALIRTLAMNPEILLLDEPFSALDYQTRLAICEEISTIIRKEQKTAIFVTHDISEAISIADRVVVFSGRPATIKKEFIIELPAESPLARRQMTAFPGYFDAIWKELELHV